MKVISLNVHPDFNYDFSFLLGETGKPNSYASMTIENLAEDYPNISEGYQLLFKEVLDVEEVDLEYPVASVKFDEDGNFKALYQLQVFKGEDDRLCTKLGRDVVYFKDLGEIGSVDVVATEQAISRFKEMCLFLSYEIEDNYFIELYLPFRFTEEAYNEMLEEQKDGTKKMNYRAVTSLVKKGRWEELAQMLATPPAGSEYESCKMVDLPENVDLPVISSRIFTGGNYGDVHILLIELPDGSKVETFAPGNLNTLLMNGSSIKKDTTVSHKPYKNSKGDIRTKAFFKNLQLPKRRVKLV